MRNIVCIATTLMLLSACDWLGGEEEKAAKLEGTRYDVLVGEGALQADEATADYLVDVPQAQGNTAWESRQDALDFGALRVKNLREVAEITVGEGADFEQGLAPAPVVAQGLLIAMDASGVISAHPLKDLSQTAWVNSDGVEEDAPAMLGGGLTAHKNTLVAGTGYGRVLAVNLKNGKTLWKARAGAPVRGAPAVSNETVIALTADNRTIALRAADGQPRWEHRGIYENAGFFSMTSPIISDGIALVAYSSGEVFALRLETGNPAWTDTLSSNDRTNAAAAFAGVNADPAVQDGVAYVVSAAGSMVASAVLNGRPLWQQEVSALVSPWPAGNVVYVLTAQQQLAALLKRDGSVRWVKNLAEKDDDGKLLTPKRFAPILVNNTVLVVDDVGRILRFDAASGKRLPTVEIEEGVAASPIVAQGTLYLLFRDATLRAFR